MDMNRVDGTVKSAIGKGEEFIGNIYGRTKDGFNDAVDRLPDALSGAADMGQRAYKESSQQIGARVGKQPLETLLLVGALGFLVGWAVNRSAR